ncbi:MAG: DUF2249 domain-containing protein [Deltaproteobacteria bacterium]|nr:DUF2249 domain-containing protein [Deltaproteobacteria bacterium]
METLDLRALPPPEPLERVLCEVETRPAGAIFCVVLRHEPHPLFALLRQAGCTWRGEAIEHGYKLTITIGR